MFRIMCFQAIAAFALASVCLAAIPPKQKIDLVALKALRQDVQSQLVGDWTLTKIDKVAINDENRRRAHEIAKIPKITTELRVSNLGRSYQIKLSNQETKSGHLSVLPEIESNPSDREIRFYEGQSKPMGYSMDAKIQIKRLLENQTLELECEHGGRKVILTFKKA